MTRESSASQAEHAELSAAWLRDLHAITNEAQRRHDEGEESIEVWNFIDQALEWLTARGSEVQIPGFEDNRTLEQVLRWPVQ